MLEYLSDRKGVQAWEIDRLLRLNAVPVDRRKEASQWYSSETTFPTGDDLIALFWEARVPGSHAPEIPYVEMVESMANKGYDMREAETLLPEGMRLAKAGDRPELRALTARLLAAIHSAPPNPDSPYWSYHHPAHWSDVLAALPPEVTRGGRPEPILDLDERIHSAWLGQLAGGAFGTALEGYHFRQILKVYGRIAEYITTPETINDDVTYELVFLDVFERMGRSLTSVELGLEWLRQIPFGWSAEWIALQNLAQGILPPESGSFRNPYSDWIGAQMRGMICGLLAPAWPLEAVRLAHIDGVVSHSANGVYGEMFSAALTSLAFVHNDPRELIEDALRFLPQGSEYLDVARACLKTIQEEPEPERAWEALDQRFERYNWIHAYPNMAADLLALWHSGGDMTAAFSWLAFAGLDVDCNAGLVGTVLGVMRPTPEKWAAPLNDTLETYLPGKERLSIRELAARTSRLARI